MLNGKKCGILVQVYVGNFMKAFIKLVSREEYSAEMKLGCTDLYECS